jgi:hypothetical protein
MANRKAKLAEAKKAKVGMLVQPVKNKSEAVTIKKGAVVSMKKS